MLTRSLYSSHTGALLAAWILTGATIGAIVGTLSVWTNPSIDTSRYALGFAAFLAMSFGVGFGGIGTILAIVRALRSRGQIAGESSIRGTFARHSVVAVFSYLGYVGSQYLSGFSPRLAGGTEVNLARFFLAVGVASVLLFAGATVASRYGSPTQWARVSGPWTGLLITGLLLSAVACVLLGHNEGGGEEVVDLRATASQTNQRVLLLGLDGADWSKIRPLVERGRLPAFARLMREGTTGSLATTQPTLSPIIWTTIATGVRESRHGIFDFLEYHRPGFFTGLQGLGRLNSLLPHHIGATPVVEGFLALGLITRTPISAVQRREKAIWNVLSDQGKSVGVINWWATWPSEEVNGFIVSDNNPRRHAFVATYGETNLGHLGVTFPESLLTELEGIVPERPSLERPPTREDFEDLPFIAGLTEAEITLFLGSGVLKSSATFYDADRFAAAAGLKLWQERRPDFLAVYLSGIDNLSHLMRDGGEAVDLYYAVVDRILSRYLELLDDRTTIVIVSDHGWSYDADPSLAGHGHAPDGILILAGAGARSGHSLAARSSILDVAPTMLILFGMPVSEEMQGEPIWGGLASEITSSAPAGTIPSYGAYRPKFPALAVRDSDSADQTLENLRALGYIR